MLAIEERDGVRFYVDKTSPFSPIRLIRTPGLRRRLPLAQCVTSCSSRSGAPPGCARPTPSWPRRCGARARRSRSRRRGRCASGARWRRSSSRGRGRRGGRRARPGDARAVLYSSSTAALLAPRPGAIRFDAPAAGNRPGGTGSGSGRSSGGASARRRCWCRGARAGWPRRRRRTRTRSSCPCRSSASGAAGERDIAAITYGAHPEKKGLDRVLAAWARRAPRGRGARGRGARRARGRSFAAELERPPGAARRSRACGSRGRCRATSTARCCAARACS